MKKHYETHVEDTDKLISVAGPVLDYKSWYEQYRKLMEEQPITSSSKNLSIGYNSTIYTQMAFKNLGIYNDQLLSKDDCIKAYNYLQTLKAK